MDDNPGKKSLKFTVEITQGIPVNLILFKEQKYLSEDNTMPEIIKQKTIKKSLNIAIFDRGIQRKQSFMDFQNQNIYFISRVSTQKTVITNVKFLTACEVADLYKSRWEIETFFKFIKQELNFKHLLSRTENGIKVVMYLTMIAAILLTLYKKVNNIIGSISG